MEEIVTTEQNLQSLEPLFAEAEQTGQWFWCRYQDMWFSPKELREYHAKQQFIWNAVNWKLRDPRIQLIQMDAQIEGLKVQRQKIYDRIINHEQECNHASIDKRS